MQDTNDPASRPKDATRPTEEQREQQELLDHQHGDPEAPGRHQTRHHVPDEGSR